MKILSLPGDYCTVVRTMTCKHLHLECNLYNILFPLLRAKSSCKSHYQERVPGKSNLMNPQRYSCYYI